MRKKLMAALPILLLGTAAQAQRPQTREQFDSLQQRNRRRTGEPLPDFRLALPNGSWFTNKDLEGKVTLVNLWFRSCAPCLAEMPALNALHAKYAGDSSFRMISLTFDPDSSVAASKATYAISFPVYTLDRAEVDRIGFYNGFPTTLIVGRDGRIAHFESGGRTDPAGAAAHIRETWYPLINRLLAQ